MVLDSAYDDEPEVVAKTNAAPCASAIPGAPTTSKVPPSVIDTEVPNMARFVARPGGGDKT